MKPQIPWLRVFVEGVVIVGSILLALAADAWWDGRQDREEEQRLLASLLAEVQESLRQIDLNIRFHEALIVSADSLLAAPLSPTSHFSADSLDVLIGDLTWTRSVDFPTATLNTILFGGRLAVIESPELRERITRWQGALDEIVDVAMHDHSRAAEQVKRYVRQFGDLGQLNNAMTRVPGPLGPPGVTLVPLPGGKRDHFELLARREFRTAVLERRWAQTDLLATEGGYPNLRAAAVALIEALQHEIAR